MKFLVLFYTNFFAQCMAVKSSDAAVHLEEAAPSSTWTGCVKRFYILIFLVIVIILYYIPESRFYARKACHLIIDVVANGLKAALSGAFGNENNTGGLAKIRDIQQNHSVVANARIDNHVSESLSRKRHRVKQEPRIEDDRTRGRDKRKHRHSERSNHASREERHNENRQSQSMHRRISKEVDIRKSPTPQLNFYADKTTEGFYYPGSWNENDGPKYSTSFVTSGVKKEQRSITSLENQGYPQTIICKPQPRSRPGRRTKTEDVIHMENDGLIRDFDQSFALNSPNDCEQSYDVDDEIECSDTTLNNPEREICEKKIQPNYEESTAAIQENDNKITDWGETTDNNANEENEGLSDRRFGITTAFLTAEENRANRVKGEALPARKVNFRKKGKDNRRKEIAEDNVAPRTPSTKSEEVLGKLGDQISKLEKTIRTLKPEMTNNDRHRDEYVLYNIETVLKDMKRSFSQVGQHIKNRRRPPSSPSVDDFTADDLDDETISQEEPDSVTSVTPKNSTAAEISEEAAAQPLEREGPPEDKSSTNQLDLTIFRSDSFLYDDEISPIVTNRVKPIFNRTFNWLFTGCPGAVVKKKRSVGKDGGFINTAAE